MKRYWLILVVVSLVVVAFGSVFYVRQYFLPMRDAQRLLDLADKVPPHDECFGAFSTFLSRPPCKGDSGVKMAVLSRLATTTNREAYFYLFGMLGSMQERGVKFEDADWNIIQKATERHGEMPERNLRYFVTTNDGRPWLGAGEVRGRP